MLRSINEYWSRHLSNYSFEERVQYFRQRKCSEIVGPLINESSIVLEIGPGFTPIADKLKHFGSYVGVEPGELPFNTLVSRFSSDSRIRIHQNTFGEMKNKLEHSSFDVIVSSSVLGEGGINPTDFLNQLGALMKPGSFAYINVANKRSMHRIIGKEAGYLQALGDLSPRQSNLGVRELYDLPGLINAVTSSIEGAVVVKSGSFLIKPFTHEQLSSALQDGIIGEDVVEALYQISSFFPDAGAELYVLFQLSA